MFNCNKYDLAVYPVVTILSSIPKRGKGKNKSLYPVFRHGFSTCGIPTARISSLCALWPIRTWYVYEINVFVLKGAIIYLSWLDSYRLVNNNNNNLQYSIVLSQYLCHSLLFKCWINIVWVIDYCSTYMHTHNNFRGWARGHMGGC